MRSKTSREPTGLARFDYPLTCFLFALVALYAIGWLVVDILTATGGWPSSSDFDAASFKNELTVVNQIAFYGLNLANAATLVALVRRSRLALVFFAVSFALGVTDWILLSFNPHFDGHVDGYVVFGLQAYVIWRLFRHIQRGSLR